MPLRFAEVTANDGFDGSGATPWQMVPVGDYKLVRLFGCPACVDLHSDMPNVASVTYDNLGTCVSMYVRGLTPGRANIVAKDADGNEVKLLVSVKARRTVNTTFNFVSDNAGHRTTRPSNLDDVLVNINSILKPQINVVLKLMNSRSVRISQDLGKVIVTRSDPASTMPGEDPWPAFLQQKDSMADFNVFFVWEVQASETFAMNDDVNAMTRDGICLCEDQLDRPLGATLAHETGHFLGVGHDVDAKNASWLMYSPKNDDSPERSGVKIPRIHADLMNLDR